MTNPANNMDEARNLLRDFFTLASEMQTHLNDAIYDIDHGNDSRGLRTLRVKTINEFEARLSKLRTAYISKNDLGEAPGNNGLSPSAGAIALERLIKADALLREHHKWHLEQCVQDATLNGLDMGAEYADSDMFERTEAFLNSSPPSPEPGAMKTCPNPECIAGKVHAYTENHDLSDCPTCKGTGQIRATPGWHDCEKCHGTGMKNGVRAIERLKTENERLTTLCNENAVLAVEREAEIARKDAVIDSLRDALQAISDHYVQWGGTYSPAKMADDALARFAQKGKS